ncbi:MAG: DNA polymerase III subunit gamma/tau [Oscillospiraceae bacterium]|nr:DNA polymerase III subunit gamma/tau [Oscillospiraceae bacterium]
MYQALYRKWRPRTFDDVVGQDHITTTLKRQVQTGRLSHAYLFIGTRGTGKTTCAKILARAVNCEHPIDGNPCNQCAACRGIEEGSILDVVELDAASNNRVDDVRALQDEAIFSPASVKKRVYIIDEVHMLSTAAFNALLKILEEPPEHLMFILCTTELHKVLPTIVSRCQRHSFKRIEPEAIAGRLAYVAEQEGLTLEPEAGALLARLADGGMRDALSLLDQCAATEHICSQEVLSAMGLAGSQRTAELLDAVCAGSSEKALTTFNALWKDGKDPAGILDELAGLMRDVLLLQVAPQSGDSLLSGLYEKKTLQYFAAKLPGARLMDGMNEIRAADLSGANPRRTAELCLVRLCVPETGDTLAGLKTRVARLETAWKTGIAPSASVPASPLPETSEPIKPLQASAPEPKPAPTMSAEDVPWYTDNDAPPEEPDFMPPVEPEPEPTPVRAVAPPPPPSEPEPTPAPPQTAPSEPGGTFWDTLIHNLNGKVDMGTYAILALPTQVAGSLAGDVLTVYLLSPIAKMMVNTPAMSAAIQSEASAIAGKPVRVSFSDQPPAPSPTAPSTQPDTSKLDALKKFPNFRIE